VVTALPFDVPAALRAQAALGDDWASWLDGLPRLVAEIASDWEIAFQQDNATAARFWRRIADEVFGAWTEEPRPVPDKPDVPPDHWITGSNRPA
jgi:hypothetical protein